MYLFLNQLGFLPNAKKEAVLTRPAVAFAVKKWDEALLAEVSLEKAQAKETAFAGEIRGFGPDEDSGDDVYVADFSAFSVPGCYVLLAGEEVSHPFVIGKEVYDKPLFDVMKAYYFLRCGTALTAPYAGAFVHDICHTGTAFVWEECFDEEGNKRPEGPKTKLELQGGWHDAGDYGRYITAASCALAQLFYAWRLYPDALKNLALQIPESGGSLPDVLAECKWELDWMLKMQRPDGALYHKLTSAQHAPFCMPEEDRAQFYVLPVSSMATADFAAVCALAAGIYEAYDADFAENLLQAAKRAAAWLLEHPDPVLFRNPKGCGTGEYGEREDADNRFWAFAELYARTGEAAYHAQMKAAMAAGFPLDPLGYGMVSGLGSLAYLSCEQEKEEALEEAMREAFLQRAALLKEKADACGYGVAMMERDYCWGSNGNVGKNGMVFLIADLLGGEKKYLPYAQTQLDYLLGKNAMGMSYITGNGKKAYRYPHLRPAHCDGIDECMPGMVSGGPNRGRTDGAAKALVLEGTPPMKCYADHVSCYSLNEITIYWNSPVVFLLAGILSNT